MIKKSRVKISSKGQITIPKKMREQLDSEYLEIEQKDKEIVLREARSVEQLAGSLSDYAGKKRDIPENEAWSENVKEKHSST
jgi:AbrB family looped-hinge helix DNA binding protein